MEMDSGPSSKTLHELTETAIRSKGTVEYLKDLDRYKAEKPYTLGFDIELEDESERTNLECEKRDIVIHDLREKWREVNINDHGFELQPLPADVVDTYFADIEPLAEIEGAALVLRKRFKTEHVIVFDHRYRKEQRQSEGEWYTNKEQPAYSLLVNNPHADQTATGGLKRVRRHLSEDEFSMYGRKDWRIRIINFWKPIRHEIRRAPLIFCDHFTIEESQRVPCDTVSATYVGESIFLKHSTYHRWCWFSKQQLNEALLFVSYDSEADATVPYCFHSSCDLPPAAVDPSWPLRESMEVRALVITKTQKEGSHNIV